MRLTNRAFRTLARLTIPAICTIALASCATDAPAPEVRTVTNTIYVKVPTPCVDPADIPEVPTPTPVDADHATHDQLDAAAALDIAKLDSYAKKAAPIILQCSKPTKEIKP